MCRIEKYGLPRRLNDGDVTLWGVLDGVGVYAETGSDHRRPDVVYVLVDRAGMFQPYQNMTGDGCGG